MEKMKKGNYVYHTSGLCGRITKLSIAFVYVDTQVGIRVWNYEDITLSLRSRVRNRLLRFFKWFFKVKI